MYVYIYIYRERGRDTSPSRSLSLYIYIYISLSIYTYIYIYISKRSDSCLLAFLETAFSKPPAGFAALHNLGKLPDLYKGKPLLKANPL